MISRQVTIDQKIHVYSASNSMANSLEIASMEIDSIQRNLETLMTVAKAEPTTLDEKDKKSFEVLLSLIQEAAESLRTIEGFAEDTDSDTDLKNWYNKQPLEYFKQEEK